MLATLPPLTIGAEPPVVYPLDNSSDLTLRWKEACGYNLRTRPHNFALPVNDDTNFVSRLLYAELKS